jgi:hypothetical protein
MGRDDGGFGSGMAGMFGGRAYDPHREWEGPFTTRGVFRSGSRIPRAHEDEHPHDPPPHPSLHREHGGFSNYAGGGDRDRFFPPNPHFSEAEAREMEARRYEQHGYGQSQFADPSDWERESGPHYGKGPKGYKRSDERIREEICEVMSRQGFVDASDVEVFVEAGIVRLVGTVASRYDKRALEQMADRVHGVEEVENEIRLRREPPRAAPPPQGNGRPVHS